MLKQFLVFSQASSLKWVVKELPSTILPSIRVTCSNGAVPFLSPTDRNHSDTRPAPVVASLGIPNRYMNEVRLMQTHVLRTFANSNKTFRSLENLLTKKPLVRTHVIRTFRNSNLFTAPQRVRIRQSWNSRINLQ